MGYFMYNCNINPIGKIIPAKAGLGENQMKGAEMLLEASSTIGLGSEALTTHLQKRWR